MLLECRFERHKKFCFQERQCVSLCRVVVGYDLKIENAARAVIQSGDCRVEVAAPADEARNEGSVIRVPVCRRDLGIAAHDPTLKVWNLARDSTIHDHNHREIPRDLIAGRQCRKRFGVEHPRAYGSDKWHGCDRSHTDHARKSLDVGDIAAFNLISETARGISVLAEPYIAALTGLFKIRDHVPLLGFSPHAEKPHARDEALLAARAPAQQVSRFHSTTAVRRRHRFDCIDAGEFFRYPLGVVVADDVGETI